MRRKIATSLRRLAGRIDPSPVSVSVSIVHVDGHAVARAVASQRSRRRVRSSAPLVPRDPTIPSN